jgi:hypothetical protein
MVGPRLSNAFESLEWVDEVGNDSIADYVETITLLQEEVTRLEQELRLRDQAQSETMSTGIAAARDEPESSDPRENVAAVEQEVKALEAELASREETIGLLLDQLRLVEEAEAANRVEWERLAEWVAELELRVEGQDEDAVRGLRDQCAAQQRQADGLRLESERQRRVWETQRQAYEGEIARLQAMLVKVPASGPAEGNDEGPTDPGSHPEAGVIQALQEENLRLRFDWQELVDQNAAQDPTALRTKLSDTLNERDEFRRQLELVQDERKRESLEREATVAELQTRLSRASLARPEEPLVEKEAESHARALDADLRIRALRQHLLEIHHRESEERSSNRLTSRLSRLWSRTRPR